MNVLRNIATGVVDDLEEQFHRAQVVQGLLGRSYRLTEGSATIANEGMPNVIFITAAARIHRDRLSSTTAKPVRRLRALGYDVLFTPAM